MNYNRPCTLFAALLLSVTASSGQKVVIDHNRIDEYIVSEINKWHVPGCAVAIVKGDSILYEKGYGYRNVEARLPVTINTVFKIASCTKSFTAAAAGILVGEHALEWDTPVINYLPQLRLSDANVTREITMRDLLTHRTGLYDDDWSWVGDHVDKNRMFEILSAMPQEAPIRTKFIYSNICYALAGQVVVESSGYSWRRLIEKDFFQPLGMSSSLFSHSDSSGVSDFSYGYEFQDSSRSYLRGNLQEHRTDSLSVCEAFGFISTSAYDLSKWIRLFINGGVWKGRQLIPPAVFRELVKPVNYMDAGDGKDLSESYYCMGWLQNYYKGRRLIQHSGGLWGFKSYMSFMPLDSLGIVILTNGQPYQLPRDMTYDLYDIILGLPKTLWADKDYTEAQKPAAANSTVEVTGTRPSKPLKAYVGTYYSKWIGAMRVTLHDDALFFKFHTYPEERMIHAHYDTFFTGANREAGKGITFQFDHDGNVTGMLLDDFTLEKIE